MTTEEKLHALLCGAAPIAARVGQRIYAVVAPVTAARPYIVVTRLNGARIGTLDGTTGWSRARFQVSCWSDDATASRTVANAVRALLDGYAGADIPSARVLAEADVYDDQADAVGRAVDLSIMIQE